TGLPEARILVLEAGPSDWSPFIRFPAGVVRAARVYNWGYRSQPDPTCNNLTGEWARGRVLGGSSSINSTVYVRGAARDFDRWAATLPPESRPGWSADAVMPIFKEMENSDQRSARRGHGGPLHVRTIKHPHRITTAFVEAAVACGYPFNEDYN